VLRVKMKMGYRRLLIDAGQATSMGDTPVRRRFMPVRRPASAGDRHRRATGNSKPLPKQGFANINNENKTLTESSLP
jgi:hypothetical protein